MERLTNVCGVKGLEEFSKELKHHIQDSIRLYNQISEEKMIDEDVSDKGNMTRAVNALRRLKDMGLDPTRMTDDEVLQDVRNLGVKSLPFLRKITRKDVQTCPHCGLPVDLPKRPYGEGIAKTKHKQYI